MPEIPDDLIPPKEAVKLLPRKVQLSTLHRWILSGRLRGWRFGRRWYVSRADLPGLLAPHVVRAPTPVQPAASKATTAEVRARGEAAMERLRQKGWRC